ncbi:hypothetical protein [Roseospira visakhapatnamensis]|uniref:Uncharacterized protein n=1 Tax=Roseospira visakhapatnamensis TaxID=390880 RepID=A0A7W6WAW4_9PROT|nr:hypothetical protein [Roseospira visakhapatnamensis]MBB4266927.1 hypothetical protein [Roseospira visakhapatnamensis]
MTVSGLPQSTAPVLPIDPATAGRGVGARRSLLDQGASGAAGLASFRRLDLTTQTPPPPTPAAQTPTPSTVGRTGPEARPRPDIAAGDRPREDRASPDAREAATAAPGTTQGSSGRGSSLLDTLRTGRVSLLSGALGFLAQLFGQKAGAAAPTAGAGRADAGTATTQAADVSRAVSAVTDDGATDAAERIPPPSRLETRTGVGTYDLVNRLVGASSDTRRDGRIELTLSLPFGPVSTSIDQVA